MSTSIYKKLAGLQNRIELAKEVLDHGVNISFQGNVREEKGTLHFAALPVEGDSITVGSYKAVFKKV